MIVLRRMLIVRAGRKDMSQIQKENAKNPSAIDGKTPKRCGSEIVLEVAIAEDRTLIGNGKGIAFTENKTKTKSANQPADTELPMPKNFGRKRADGLS